MHIFLPLNMWLCCGTFSLGFKYKLHLPGDRPDLAIVSQTPSHYPQERKWGVFFCLFFLSRKWVWDDTARPSRWFDNHDHYWNNEERCVPVSNPLMSLGDVWEAEEGGRGQMCVSWPVTRKARAEGQLGRRQTPRTRWAGRTNRCCVWTTGCRTTVTTDVHVRTQTDR